MVRRAQMQASQQFSDLAAESEQAIRDLLEAAKHNLAEELQRRRYTLNEAQRMTRQEKKEKTVALNEKEKQVQNLLDRVNEMLSA